MFGIIPYRTKVIFPIQSNEDTQQRAEHSTNECLVNIYDRVSEVLTFLCSKFSIGDSSNFSLSVLLPKEADSTSLGPAISHPLWPWGTLREQLSSMDHKDWLTLQISHQPHDTDRLESSNNLWDDPFYTASQSSQNETLQAGSLNRLVIELTSESEFFELPYVPIFFYTYRSFASPEQLLQKLSQRYFDIPPTVIPTLRYVESFYFILFYYLFLLLVLQNN